MVHHGKYHDIPCYPTVYHVIPWYTVVYHKIPWSWNAMVYFHKGGAGAWTGDILTVY